jgi:hypothetical protein
MVKEAQDPYVGAYASYHLGRLLLDADDPERAAEVFADFLREHKNLTPLDAEVAYFHGCSLARIPAREAAGRSLADFLRFFPAAPERFRAAAQQLIAELAAQDTALHEIADSMKGVERRIRRTDTGEDTRKKQDEIVVELQQIIEELEKQEQSSGPGGGNFNSSNPASRSAVREGGSRIGELEQVRGVVDRWGMMRDRDRRAIENDIQMKLDGRMRKLVEDYYRKLSRSAGQ